VNAGDSRGKVKAGFLSELVAKMMLCLDQWLLELHGMYSCGCSTFYFLFFFFWLKYVFFFISKKILLKKRKAP
jgi:hypothetical protein